MKIGELARKDGWARTIAISRVNIGHVSAAKLFTPLRVGNLQLANRIVVAPMCQYSAESGCMSDWHVIHLGQLAISGAATLTAPPAGSSRILEVL